MVLKNSYATHSFYGNFKLKKKKNPKLYIFTTYKEVKVIKKSYTSMHLKVILLIINEVIKT